MADSAVAITSGAGTSIDTRTEATNGHHRQVVVIGDPSLNAGVAPVDATNGLAVQIIPAIPSGANIIGRVGHDQTGIGDGVKTVTTAGTDVALATTTSCKRVIIQSQTDNTGLIAVGATGVDATEATGDGIILYPGDALELFIDDLADIFIDATVSGEGVRFTYFT